MIAAIFMVEVRAFGQTMYSIQAIPLPGGFVHFVPHHINSKGWVAGKVKRNPSMNPVDGRPCVFDGHSVRVLPGFGSGSLPFGCAFSVDNNGSVIGGVQSKSGPWRAVIWKHGKLFPLRPEPDADPNHDSYCIAINDRGWIAGQDINYHAFFYKSGHVTDIGNLGVSITFVTGLNNIGDVVGYSAVDNVRNAGFVWSNRTLVKLPSLGGRESAALAINNLRTVVGQADTQDNQQHACKWVNHKPVDLYTLGGTRSEASSINNFDVAVGWSIGRQGVSRAVMWDRAGIWDLNQKLVNPGRWTLRDAIGINDKGQIVGTGMLGNLDRAFIMTPVRTPLQRAKNRLQ